MLAEGPALSALQRYESLSSSSAPSSSLEALSRMQSAERKPSWDRPLLPDAASRNSSVEGGANRWLGY